MSIVRIGPDNQSSKSLMKAIVSRKHHLDLVFKCDDGTHNAHRFMVAAQSKFLKNLLLEQDDRDVAEILLPGVKIEHLKRALKFMYTGKLTVTNAELYKNYLVWHVQKIITEILRIDANLNLGTLKLEPPPNDEDSGEPPPPDSSAPGSSSTGSRYDNSSNAESPPSRDSGQQEVCKFSNEGGYRQQTGLQTNDENNIEPSSAVPFPSSCQRMDESDIEVLETPRVPTPQIIDLLDSDDDEETLQLPNDCEPVSLIETAQASEISSPVQVEKVGTDSNGTDLTTTNYLTEMGPDEKKNGSAEITPERNNQRKKRKSHNKTKRNGLKKTKKGSPIKKHKLNADPQKIVYRGKLINADEKPKKTAPPKGIRKHIHNAWTLTGLKRAESLVTVKEESAEHACDKCDAVFQKHKSLIVHKQRNHNENMKSSCPECGKKLSTPNAIKKHLLTHRPEEEWPFECPLCHKKFQARADIPKHLMTKIHEKDEIPVMGTQEWFSLLYPEKYGNVKDIIVKVEKQKEKERKKLVKLKKADVSVEEYDNWDPTVSTDQQSSSCVINGRRRSSNEKRRSRSKSISETQEVENNTKRMRRSAATIASGFIAGICASENL